MGISHQQLIQTLKNEVDLVSERYPGYRRDLMEALADLVAIEADHERSPTRVFQRVSDKIEALGDLIDRRTSGKAVT